MMELNNKLDNIYSVVFRMLYLMEMYQEFSGQRELSELVDEIKLIRKEGQNVWQLIRLYLAGRFHLKECGDRSHTS